MTSNLISFILLIYQKKDFYWNNYVFHRPRNPVFANNYLTEYRITMEILHNFLKTLS